MPIGKFEASTLVKLYRDQLNLNDTAKVLTGTDDPRSVAKDAPQGSLYLQTGATGGKLFRKLDAGSTTNWTEVGSGAGGINYITNPDAEAGTTGWATYADAAAATPVDGTGGSPTVTLTASTSSPLRGLQSFLITKDAANRQGEGVSVLFGIDAADKAEVMAIEFDYMVDSGTFVAGSASDLQVFIYDVTNAQLITPAPLTIASHTQSKFKGVFQTASNSTSYRLILHVATTSASAWTFKFDNVRVGPQEVLFGAPVTDFTSFTTTITGSVMNPVRGTVAVEKAYWRRVGDSVQVIFQYEQTVAGTAGSGTYSFSLPPGLVIDSTKINSASSNVQAKSVGTGATFDGTTARGANVYMSSTNTVALLLSDAAVLGSNSNISFGNATLWISFEYMIPILGWSSQLQLSDSAETRIVAVSATATGVTISAGALANIVFDTELTDTHNVFDLTTFTVPVAGLYNLTANLRMNPGGSAATLNSQFQKNGVVIGMGASNGLDSVGQNYTNSVLVHAVPLVPGDLITLKANHNGATVTGDVGVAYERVTGPTAIAANELIAAQYSRNTTQSVNNATITICNFDDVVFDTHGAVTTGASWKFTAPVTGKYLVNVNVIFGGNATGTRDLYIYKNNASVANVMSVASNTLSFTGTAGSHLVSMVPGDFVDIRVQQSSGGALDICPGATAEQMVISIHRVGF